MSQLYTALVNETVVEAVRVALDEHATSHHTTLEASAVPGVITDAEESIIRRAVLLGLQNLRHAQSTITSSTRQAASQRVRSATPVGEASERGSTGNGNDGGAQALHAARAAAASSLQRGLSQLMHNASALQNVVQRVAVVLEAHLGDSSQPETRDAGAVASVYAAAPAVTQVLEAAVEQQLSWTGTAGDAAVSTDAAAGAGALFTSAHSLWLTATVLIGYLMVRFVFGRLLGFGGALNRRRRTRTVLIGLPDSGKTALFAQLVRRMQLRETRTSMRENVGPLQAAKEKGVAETAPGVSIVDCPGHPRLREYMLRAVSEAVNVVVVVDAVTVQDSQHDGVAALAELLLGVLQAPEFYGVQRVLFACTKRDEVTSYAAKAVRKLLEAAMVASIESRQNAMGRVESVRDANNAVIASRKSGRGGGGGGRRYVLSVEGGEVSSSAGGVHDISRSQLRGDGNGVKKFSFEQLGIPVAFVDVSSRPHPTDHKYTVTPVEDFILEK